jgi:hypothetical protein
MLKIILEMDRKRARYLAEASYVLAFIGKGDFQPMFKLLRPEETKKDLMSWLVFEEELKAVIIPQNFYKTYKNIKECRVAWDVEMELMSCLNRSKNPQLIVRVELDRDQAIKFMKACEIVARIGMGQFRDMIELLSPDLNWDEVSAIEKLLKGKIFPELISNSYHAMHSKKCSEECKIAWDAYQHIRREISWYDVGKDWRTDARDWGNGMIGVNFDEPNLRHSKLKGDFKVERIEK